MKNIDLSELTSFYKINLGFNEFYNHIFASIGKIEFTSTEYLLYGLREYRDVEAKKIPKFFADTNTLRVDVPVWFGDFQRSKNKILVYGQEPRDTDKLFDIETIGNHIYAAPFGCDRWNEKSKIKVQLKYLRIFKDIIEKQDTFIIFSDIVKYYITGICNKKQNDTRAGKIFLRLANKGENIEFLKEEIRLVNPTKILLLGNKSYYFYKDNIALGDFHLIPHPSHGGEKNAIREIRKILLLL